MRHDHIIERIGADFAAGTLEEQFKDEGPIFIIEVKSPKPVLSSSGVTVVSLTEERGHDLTLPK
ncbi:hypothetical protein VM57_00600 [Stenotrophomonas maltophilia]|uniref:Uncharacterized protein n=1 Tax=Stenotrophomonas maltophilia TaxID=40324 RepID=A0A0F5ZPU7_STEMA|nr:hypothetical protein VM57_00600 [Stenotrophomonas maltophilia]